MSVYAVFFLDILASFIARFARIFGSIFQLREIRLSLLARKTRVFKVFAGLDILLFLLARSTGGISFGVRFLSTTLSKMQK